jgi:hypothetical protein
MAIQLSIVRIGALKRRQKHRWKESNPRGAGLESGLLPKLTDKVWEMKRAALVGRSRRAAPVWIYRSHRWTAVTRAPLAIKFIGVGMRVQGSQARQHGYALFAPRLPGVLRFAEHGEFSLVV